MLIIFHWKFVRVTFMHRIKLIMMVIYLIYYNMVSILDNEYLIKVTAFGNLDNSVNLDEMTSTLIIIKVVVVSVVIALIIRIITLA